MTASSSSLDFDPEFDSDGKVETNFGGAVLTMDELAATTIDGLGRTIAAGGVDGSFALARYNLDGSLDGTFGPQGVGYVTTDIDPDKDDIILEVAIDGHGRIVVAGDNIGVSSASTIARYNVDGSLDTTFGPTGSGSFSYDFGTPSDIIIDGTGRILVASDELTVVEPDGQAYQQASFNVRGVDIDAEGNILTIGVNGLFQLDPTTLANVPGGVYRNDIQGEHIRIDSRGRIVIGNGGIVSRLNSDGTNDTSFGIYGTGELPHFLGSNIVSLAFDPEGRILVATESPGLRLHRIRVDGYGIEYPGQPIFEEGNVSFSLVETPRDVEPAPQGKITLGAYLDESLPPVDRDFGLARLGHDQLLAAAPHICALSFYPGPTPDTTWISAAVTDPNGYQEVMRVDFYEDLNGDEIPDPNELIGWDTIRSDGWEIPFDDFVDLTGMPERTFMAVATDVTGLVSDVVVVTVGLPPLPPPFTEVEVFADHPWNFYEVVDGTYNPTIDFGTVVQFETPEPTVSFYVNNVGSSDLILGPLSVPSGFSIVDDLVGSIPPLRIRCVCLAA